MSEATIIPQPEVQDVELHELQDGIYKVVLARNALVDGESAERLGRRLGALAVKQPIAVVLQVTGVASVNRAAMDAYTGIPWVSAWAILGETPVDRLIGHYMLRAEFGAGVAQYFSSEEAALTWLASRGNVH